MTTGGIISVAFLVVMIALVLWNIRGHPRGGDESGNDSIGGGYESGGGSDGGGGD